jgi:Raf kinase inhibitor-like YbhB/YbcL family protein
MKLCVALALAFASTGGFAADASFVLKSGDPALGTAQFPDKYILNDFGCTGGNESPPLRWSGAPKGTQSFVVTLFDMDEHNTPSGWWHWVVYDLPANVSELATNTGVLDSKSLPARAHQGRTDLGTDAYHGPCPDKSDKPHRYVFTIYALKVPKLSVPADPSGAMVVYSLQEHLLGKASMIVHHGR